MRIVIVGGGIAAVYLANNIKKKNSASEVVIVSDEKYPPYDRIHLCGLVDDSKNIEEVKLALDPTVQLELDQKITTVDREKKRVYSQDAMFSYDKLILATGSIPIALFDISNIKNAAVFRSVEDCNVIKEGARHKEVVVIGSGPIGLELLETLNDIDTIEHVTLLIRGKHLYDKYLSIDAIKTIEECYTKRGKIKISYEDEIVEKTVENGEITSLKTKKLEISNPFVIFGTGIKPNIESFRGTLEANKGILTNRFMQTEDADIYAVGECAEVRDLHFVAGHVKECTAQADCAIAHMLGLEPQEFTLGTTIDMLKVGEFDLVEVGSPKFSPEHEKVVIASKSENRIDEYFLVDKKLVRFIGINSNVDVGYLEN
ncbi:MAG: FAD-dependent oxidoreductase, partial [Thiovulaceae bacterium]|nr:FAD-dependent oxidoreductase [Sulfurimonadaceae bacterium]